MSTLTIIVSTAATILPIAGYPMYASAPEAVSHEKVLEIKRAFEKGPSRKSLAELMKEGHYLIAAP
ncbi:MAG: hypothetical protein IPM23_13825 [Candidatus Melainabacteria bacterium]|nr:hypothetical protein [Candidatus Melainabacteria bacterium]